MKIKTSELVGNPLAWAVAVSDGNEPFFWANWEGEEFPETDDGPFRPDLDWEYGGPIIEREKITVSALYDQKNPPKPEYALGEWGAFIPCGVEAIGTSSGPTPLIAAMRCYCCAKLGEFVDIPEELCQQESN